MFKRKPKTVEKKPALKKASSPAVIVPPPPPVDDLDAERLLLGVDVEVGAVMAMGQLGTTAQHLIEEIRRYLKSHG